MLNPGLSFLLTGQEGVERPPLQWPQTDLPACGTVSGSPSSKPENNAKWLQPKIFLNVIFIVFFPITI